MSSKINILTIASSNPHPGSAPYNEYSVPISQKFNITYCSYLPLGSIELNKNMTYHSGNGSSKGLYKLLVKLIKTENYNVVHLHNLNIAIIFILAALFNKPSMLKKTLFTFHTSYNLLSFRNKIFFAICVIFINKIACCSKSSYKSVFKPYKTIFKKKFTTITNGFNNNLVDSISNEEKGPNDASFLMVVVGRLVPGKRPFAVVDAFEAANLSTGELVFVGNGPLEDELTDYIKQKRLEKSIRLVGKVPRIEVFSWMRKADLFVSASLGEGMPIAVLEAIANGCLVLLSDIPPHREIDEGLDIIPKFNYESTPELSEKMVQVFNMPMTQKENLLKQYNELVFTKYSLENMLNKYINIYEGK